MAADWTAIVAMITAALSAAAAILAWLAKLQWSKQYKEAKEAQIGTLQSQIDTVALAKAEAVRARDDIIAAREAEIRVLREQISQLRHMQSPQAEEFVNRTREKLESYIDTLKANIQTLEQAADSKQSEIARLQTGDEERRRETERLKFERDELRRTAEDLQRQLKDASEKKEADLEKAVASSSSIVANSLAANRVHFGGGSWRYGLIFASSSDWERIEMDRLKEKYK